MRDRLERLGEIKDDVLDRLGEAAETLHDEIKEVRKYYWEGIAKLKRKPLSVTLVDLFELPLIDSAENFQQLVTTVCTENPELVKDMYAMHQQHNLYLENGATIGLLSLSTERDGRIRTQDVVLAMYADSQGDHFVGFVPSLGCSTSAIDDATGEAGGSNYYVYHTTLGYDTLRLRAQIFNGSIRRRSLAAFAEGETYSPPTFDYEIATMSPINYLALAIHGEITGETVYPLAFPDASQ